LDAKAEQRFAVSLGPHKFAFRRQHLSKRDRNSLVSFWDQPLVIAGFTVDSNGNESPDGDVLIRED